MPWTQNKELKDSLVDMYKANPNVNQELRQRLSPPHGGPHPSTFQAAVCLQSPSPPPPPSCPGDMEAAAAPSPAHFTQTDGRDHAPSLQTDSGGHTYLGSMDTRGLSREKNVSFLLKELDSLRAVNNKLQLQLVHKQKEVEEHHLGEETKTSPQLLSQAVLQELFAAQKDRDQALMSRLRLANEERDEALLRAKHLQQSTAGMEVITPEFNMDQDVEAVLSHLAVADSALSVQQGGAVLLALLQKARQRRHDITTQEMVVLMDQRDRTAVKLNRLEQLTRENNQAKHNVCQEELERADRERNEAVEQNQRLKEQLKDDGLHSETCLDQSSRPSRSALPRDRGSVLGIDGGQEPPMDLEHQLHVALQAEREAGSKIHRLERLVEVLRKKVGTGNLRSVI